MILPTLDNYNRYGLGLSIASRCTTVTFATETNRISNILSRSYLVVLLFTKIVNACAFDLHTIVNECLFVCFNFFTDWLL